MNASKRILLLLGLICIAIIIWFGINFAPGSYPYVERYKFNVSEEELIGHINKLRVLDANLKVPDSCGLKEGKSNANDHWHHFYLFYSEEQEVIYCWVRASSLTSADLGFVSVIDRYGVNKLINKDFNRSENSAQKKKFEEYFIDRLEKLVHNDDNVSE